MEKLFYEIVQVAIGKRKSLSCNPSDEKWNELYNICQKQAVTGLVFDSLDKLYKQDQKPPIALLYNWIGANEQIILQNHIVNKRCVDVTNLFAEAGFRSCILKGQGNALLYPNPLARISGDIDIWIDASREAIRKFVVSRCNDIQDGNLHIDFPIFDDVIVEVHYNPSQDNSRKYNKRLQTWYVEHAEEQFTHKVTLEGGEISVPTLAFNAIHQMSHMINHFFIEGIGLRHFVDYYYVLTNSELTNRTVVADALRYLGMEKFARGVMWIEHQCLGLDNEHLLFEPSERIGKVILKEMEEGGNFGHHDERYSLRRKGLLARGIADTGRLLRLAMVFPSESILKIVKKAENQKWKLKF